MGKMSGSLFRRIVSGVVALLLLFYVGYQIYQAKYSPVRTEETTYFTASNSIQTSVIALRHETLLTQKTKGVADFTVNQGERVCKNGIVAKIYGSESQITAQHQLEQLDLSIAQLQNLQQPGSVYSFSPDTANERICLKLTEILGKANSGDLSEAYGEKNSLLTLLNEKQIASGKVKDFSSRISALQAQRKTLAAQAGSSVGTLTSPVAGYFIRSTDGFENAWDLSKISSISASDVKQLQSRKQTPVADTAGKISEDFNWYLVCVVPNDKLVGLKQLGSDEPASVRFPFVSGMSVTATVEAVNQASADSEAAVVLKCRDMNASLAGIRCETADISVQKYTGLRVSQKAIHYETKSKTVKDAKGNKSTVKKEVEGVYVLHGNQLIFRQIVPEFSTDSYVICNPQPNEDTLYTESTVKLYDEVVVEGTDLYDGKVVK